jgi:hypothetical protein
LPFSRLACTPAPAFSSRKTHSTHLPACTPALRFLCSKLNENGAAAPQIPGGEGSLRQHEFCAPALSSSSSSSSLWEGGEAEGELLTDPIRVFLLRVLCFVL